MTLPVRTLRLLPWLALASVGLPSRSAAPPRALVSESGNRILLLPQTGPSRPVAGDAYRLRLLTGGAAATVTSDRAGCVTVASRGTLRGRHYLLAEIAAACLGQPLELRLAGQALHARPDEDRERGAAGFDRGWLAATFDNYDPQTDPGPDPAAWATVAPPAPAALWSDFCGSTPCLRIEARGEGILRLPASTLTAYGFPTTVADTSVYRLMHGTTEVALKVVATCTTSCAVSMLEFYGLPRTGENAAGEWEAGDYTDGEPYHLSLVAARGNAPRIADLAVTPTKSYTPVADFPTTLRRAARNFFAAQGAHPGETHFFDQMGSAYVSGGLISRSYIVAPPSSGPANYDVLFTVPKPAASQPASLAMRIAEKPVHLSPYDAAASFRLQVKLNGVNPDTQPADWTGDAQLTHALTFPGTALAQSPTAACPGVSGGPMCLTLTPTRLSASGYDEHRVVSVELDYRRTFDLTGEGNQLLFTIPNQNARIQITGLTSGATTTILYEITNPALPRRLVSYSLSAGLLRADVDLDGACGCTTRRFAISYDVAATVPAGQLLATAAPGLRNPATGARYLILYHPDLLAGMATQSCAFTGTTITPWACFLARKQAQFGAANVRAVSIHDVYTEYASGVLDPGAIRAYLADALATWPNPKPEYVLLLGDGSVDSHDWFNHTTIEPGYKDWIPARTFDLPGDTFSGYFVSDAAYADVDDDGLADLAIGRLQARSVTDAAAMLAKLNAFDQNTFYPYAATKAWMARAAIYTDETVGGYEQFETDADAWSAGAPAPQETQKFFYGPAPYNGNTQNSTAAIACALRGSMTGRHCALNVGIANACSAGHPDNGKGSCQCDTNNAQNYQTALLAYDGHGNQLQWGADGMFNRYGVCRNTGSLADTDASLLAGAGVSPMVRLMVFNCLSGAFATIPPTPAGFTAQDVNADTVVEAALRISGGSLIGGFAPSSITDLGIPGLQMAALQSLMNGPDKIRDWGALVQSTRTALPQSPAAGNPAAFSHIDFGDPAQPLKLPSPGTPGAPVATAGNGQVGLSWSIAGLDPNTAFIRVWRAEWSVAGSPPRTAYAPLACVPSSQTAYTDAAVVNTRTYYYALSGFDNFDGTHPGCTGFEGVRSGASFATPSNPFPPAAPGAPAVTDPGTGNALRVSFPANAETDLAYYTLWRGTAPGVYTASYNLGLVTATTLGGLTEGTRYYFAVTATNTSNLTSAYGPEASGVPRQLNGGIRPPGASADLRVSKAGATDLRVDWTPVAVDYFGDPLTSPLTGQTLFHVAGAWSFNVTQLAPAQKEILTPATASFTHGGAQSGTGSWAYLVMASNAAGDGSAGAALPRGITDLRAVKSTLTPGRIAFSFSPVTADLGGTPLPIAPVYWVYRASSRPVPVDRNGAHTGAVTSLTGAFCEATARYCNDGDLATGTSFYYTLLVEDGRGQSSPY